MCQSGYFAKGLKTASKRERTRAAIMDAGLSVFAREGYEGAAISTIAKQAGLANGTFYLYFKTKEALVMELGTQMTKDIAFKVDQEVAAIEPADERLCQATQHYIRIVCADMSWGMAFFKMFWFLPDLRRAVASHLRADLERGITQGVFDAQLDAQLVDSIGAITRTAIFANLSTPSQSKVENAKRAKRAAFMQLRLLGVNSLRAGQLTHKGADKS